MRSAIALPPLAELQEAFTYDPETGVFRHRGVKRKVREGWEAGCLASSGYVLLVHRQRTYRAHRIAWLFIHEYDPLDVIIDHANGIRSDNRGVNLRVADHHLNLMNSQTPKNNTSGVKGVCFDRRRGLWRASICNKFLGRYESRDDAEEAYKQAAIDLAGEFARFK